MDEICVLLNRLVKIYQIPNIDNETVMYLAEFVMDEYQHNDLALIQEALKYPTKNRDNTWRLTPDTIRFWIDTTREKIFDRNAIEESKSRQESENTKHQYSIETEKMIEDFKIKLLDGIKPVPEMTSKEISDNGKVRPKAIQRQYTDREYVIQKELQRKWMLDVFDPITGNRKDNYLSFEEWILK